MPRQIDHSQQGARDGGVLAAATFLEGYEMNLESPRKEMQNACRAEGPAAIQREGRFRGKEQRFPRIGFLRIARWFLHTRHGFAGLCAAN